MQWYIYAIAFVVTNNILVMKILLLTMSLSVVSIGWGQNDTSRHISGANIASNIERYNKDYELVNEDALISDSSILNSLNLSSMEYLRHATIDQVYRDVDNGVAVLIYSEFRMRKTGDYINTNSSH